MRAIALPLTLIFIAWLIVRDCRRRPSVSTAVWLPTILLIVLGSRPVSMWVSGQRAYVTEMGNEAAGNLVDQLFYLFTVVGCFSVASFRGMKWNKIIATNTAIMLFYLYFAFSICWSGDPSGSLKRLAKDFGLLFAMGVIFSEKDPLLALRAVYVRCASVLFPLSVVFIKYFPNYGRNYAKSGEFEITGVATQKNSLGEIVLVFTLFLIWDYLETHPPGRRLGWRRIPWESVILILMGGWSLDLSRSKTATVCTMIGVFLVARSGLFVSKTINRAIFAGAMSLPFLLFFSQQFHSVIAPLVEAMGRDMTFTGRTNIWAQITLSTVNPIIGAGYWSFWGGPGGDAIMQAMTTIIPNAHNGYLDIYIDGGFLGLSVLFLMLVVSGLRIIKRFKISRNANLFIRVRFAILVVAIIYNLSETAFARLGPLWFTTLLVMVDFPMKAVVGTVGRTVNQGRSSILDQRSPALLNQ